MWQVDNDRYQLWRLEQDLATRHIDRLLNSVTVADRPPRFGITATPVARAVRALFKLLCGLPTALNPARRDPALGSEGVGGAQGTSL